MDAEECLRQITHDNIAVASKAFDALCDASRETLHSYLVGYGVRDFNRREDIIQEVHIKLWNTRQRFQNRGLPSWYAMLRKTAYRCWVDMFRADHAVKTQYLEDLFPDTLQELASVAPSSKSLEERQNNHRLFHLANIALFPLCPSFTPRTHTRQLLASQYFYLDGADWEEVRARLGRGDEEEPPLTREILDEWLLHHGVLRYLLYQELFICRVELTKHLLGVTSEELALCISHLTTSSRADGIDLRQICPNVKDWTWAEMQVLIWRYHFCLSADQILLRGCPLSKEEIQAVIDRSRQETPFSRDMRQLLDILRPTLGAITKSIFQTPEVWQRLAFQYAAQESLPHSDILERILVPAQLVGYEITQNALTMWLSGSRLTHKILAMCKRIQEESPRLASRWLQECCSEVALPTA